LAFLGDWEGVDRHLVPEVVMGPLAMAGLRLRFWRERDPSIWESLRERPLPNLVRMLFDSVVDGTSFPFPRGKASRGRVFFDQVRTEYLAVKGPLDEAFEVLQRAVDEGLLDLTWMKRCPALESLRADPRFAPLQERVAARVEPVRAVLLGGA
jgi:hypothetical protein